MSNVEVEARSNHFRQERDKGAIVVIDYGTRMNPFLTHYHTHFINVTPKRGEFMAWLSNSVMVYVQLL